MERRRNVNKAKALPAPRPCRLGSRVSSDSTLLLLVAIMKFSCACIVAALTAGFASTSNAFSAVAPPSSKAAKAGSSSSSGGAPNLDPVDKSMNGIDADNDSAFDPTTGSSAALTRNNKGEVWVSQVRSVQYSSYYFVANRCWSASHWSRR